MSNKNPTNHARNKWSLSVKEAAGGKCAFCGSSIRLESHHIKPLCDYPEMELMVSNGVCLCHQCHLKAHGGTFWRPEGTPINRHPWGKYSHEEIKAVQDFIAELAAAIDEKMERDDAATE